MHTLCDNIKILYDKEIYVTDYLDKIVTCNDTNIKIHDKNIKILYNYPLNGDHIFNHESQHGFSVNDIIYIICKTYDMMYKNDTTSETINYTLKSLHDTTNCTHKKIVEHRKLQDKYGIWGHDLIDLCIDGIIYDKNTSIIHIFMNTNYN